MQPRLTIGVPNRTCLRVNPWASQQEGVVFTGGGDACVPYGHIACVYG